MNNIIDFFNKHGWLKKIEKFDFNVVEDVAHFKVKASAPLFEDSGIKEFSIDLSRANNEEPLTIIDRLESVLFATELPAGTKQYDVPDSTSAPKKHHGGSASSGPSGVMPPPPPFKNGSGAKKAPGKSTEVSAPPVPNSPPASQKNNSENETARSTEPGSMEEVQKIAIQGIIKFSQLSHEELIKGAFKEAGLSTETIPNFDDLSYEEALEVIKHGNTLKRAKK